MSSAHIFYRGSRLSSEDALSHTADVEGDPSGEPPPSTPQPTEVPPELKAVPDSELLEVFEAARAVALRKTKSRVEADVLVSDVFIKLTTTRRWDPQKAPLLPYCGSSRARGSRGVGLREEGELDK